MTSEAGWYIKLSSLLFMWRNSPQLLYHWSQYSCFWTVTSHPNHGHISQQHLMWRESCAPKQCGVSQNYLWHLDASRRIGNDSSSTSKVSSLSQTAFLIKGINYVQLSVWNLLWWDCPLNIEQLVNVQMSCLINLSRSKGIGFLSRRVFVEAAALVALSTANGSHQGKLGLLKRQ